MKNSKINVNKLQELHAQGLSNRQIAKQLECGHGTVADNLKKIGLIIKKLDEETEYPWRLKSINGVFFGDYKSKEDATKQIEFFANKYMSEKKRRFIGIKDNNGVDIFEGDLVKAGNSVGRVEWFNNLSWDGRGSLHPGFYCKEWFLDDEDGELSYHFGFDDCEVVEG